MGLCVSGHGVHSKQNLKRMAPPFRTRLAILHRCCGEDCVWSARLQPCLGRQKLRLRLTTRDIVPGWGAPRIHGELLKLGIDIGETSVSKYMLRCRKPSSQTWRTFLENHVSQLVSVDFFTVPTIRFQVLYVFLVLAHDRRRILHFNVTAHPTADWTGQQLRNAFPYDKVPCHLLRDRDAIFGNDFREQVRDIGHGGGAVYAPFT